MGTIKRIDQPSANLRCRWISFCGCFIFILINVLFHSLKSFLSVNTIPTKVILYSNGTSSLKNDTLNYVKPIELHRINETRQVNHIMSYMIHHNWMDLRRNTEFSKINYKSIEPNEINRLRVLLISAFIPSSNVFYNQTKSMSLKNKQAFAAYSAWNFRYFISNPVPDRPAMWSKLIGIINAIDEQIFDWILWVDADTLISNFDLNIVNITGSNYDDKSKVLFVCRDENGLNSGVLLVRSSTIAKMILEMSFNQTQYINHVVFEQMAIKEVLENKTKFNNNYVYVKNELLNYYPTRRQMVFNENIQNYPGQYKSSPLFLYYGQEIRRKYSY